MKKHDISTGKLFSRENFLTNNIQSRPRLINQSHKLIESAKVQALCAIIGFSKSARYSARSGNSPQLDNLISGF